MSAAYWALQLIRLSPRHAGAIAVIPWNPKRQKNRSCLPPTWTKDELGKRSCIERFFGRVFLFFRLQRSSYSGWSTIVRQVALTYPASLVVALAAWQAQRTDLIRSPKRALAHLWKMPSYVTPSNIVYRSCVLVACFAVRYTRTERRMYHMPGWGRGRTSDEDDYMNGPMRLSQIQRAVSTGMRRDVFDGICSPCANL